MRNRAEPSALIGTRLWSAFDASPVGMCLCESGGRVIWSNVALCHMLAIAKDDLLGEKFFNFVDSRDVSVVFEALVQLASGGHDNFELRARLRVGTQPLATKLYLSVIRADHVSYIVIQTLNLSNQQHAEERLIARLELEKLAMSVATELINVPLEGLDAGVVQTLREVALLAGADRAALLRREGGVLAVTHEWIQARENSASTDVPPLPASAVELLTGQSQGGIVALDDSAQLSTTKPEVAKAFERTGIRAAVAIPLLREEKLEGALCFAVSRARKWDADSMALLRIAAQMIFDLIDRKTSEAALRESESRFRQLAESIDQIFWMFEIDPLRLLYASPAVERTWGVGPETELTKFAELVVPEDRQSFTDVFVGAMQKPTEREYRIERRDASRRWLRTRAFPVRDQRGVVYRVAGITEDITEAKRAATELESHRSFERLIANLSTNFINIPADELDAGIRRALRELANVTGDDCAIVYVADEGGTTAVPAYEWRNEGLPSPATPLPIPISPDDPLGRQLREEGWLRVPSVARLLDAPPVDIPYFLRLGIHSLVAMSLIARGELVGVVCFASRIEKQWAEETIALLRIAADMLANAIERIRTDKRLRRHEAELAHALRLGTIGELAAGLAHELNQPLAAILGFAVGCENRLRTGGIGPEELVVTVRKIADQALRAGEVIRSMRAHVRKSEPRREWCDVNDLLGEVLRLFADEIARNDIRLVKQLETKLPPVQVNPTQIQQILLNLLRNAVDAICLHEDNGRTIVVSTRASARGSVEISISDTGAGISPGMLDRVFEPFYTTKTGGLGLGLSIARSIAEAHGGRLWACSKEGAGTTFLLRLTGPESREGADA